MTRNADALGGKNVTRRKRWVFGRFLKVAKVPELTTLSGSEFQTVGAATEKARLAKSVRVRGTASLTAVVERGRVVRAVTTGKVVQIRVHNH